MTIEEEVAGLLQQKRLTIATAESCTGGLVAARLVSVPGVSEVFMEGLVTYSNQAKMRLLGVKEATLASFGAVSRETAVEMAGAEAAMLVSVSTRTNRTVAMEDAEILTMLLPTRIVESSLS